MFPWLPYVPSIITALCQLAKLLYDLAKERNGEAIKQCSIEIERAKASGDVKKLNELLEKMRNKGDCE